MRVWLLRPMDRYRYCRLGSQTTIMIAGTPVIVDQAVDGNAALTSFDNLHDVVETILSSDAGEVLGWQIERLESEDKSFWRARCPTRLPHSPERPYIASGGSNKRESLYRLLDAMWSAEMKLGDRQAPIEVEAPEADPFVFVSAYDDAAQAEVEGAGAAVVDGYIVIED